MDFLGFLGQPLGIVMSFIYNLVHNYFLTIFLFTLLIRLLLFPLSLKQQKSAMDRAKLAPKLERLQKKYANDRQKLAEKQQALYEKHGVSMTAGCLPMALSMIVLFGVIAAIYKPLSYLTSPAIPSQVISVAQYAIIDEDGENPNKVKSQDLAGYYGELRLMLNSEKNKQDIISEIDNPSLGALQRAYSNVTQDNYQETLDSYRALLTDKGLNGAAYYETISSMSENFTLFSGALSMLEQPWNGFDHINWLWLIPLLSGITSFAVSYVSLRYSKKGMPQDQPGQGCSNYSMLIFMPLFSTWIAFTVPGAVGIYWIFSNLLSLVQTVVINKIYDPAKARAEAEAEYQERRRKKAEDRKRLAQARQREEAEARKAEQEQERQREQSREMNKKKSKGGAQTPSKNPNKIKAREAAAEKAAEENASEMKTADEPSASADAQTKAPTAEQSDTTGKDNE
ncbi:MAG: membrane protein insertase YidC [Acutalibacteraceae bacterium]